MDIRPPKKRPPVNRPQPVPVPEIIQPITEPKALVELPTALDINLAEKTKLDQQKLSPKRSWILKLTIGLMVAILALVAGAVIWYNNALSPVNEQDTATTRLTIVSGSTPSDIAKQLKNEKLIKDVIAFDIYTRLSGKRNSLKAGTYSLSPSQSTPAIVDSLVGGKTDQKSITFYPGATILDYSSKASSRAKTDVTSVLKAAGYSESEITAALSKTYEHPLFADKPAGTSLEGYVYGETYMFDADATVEQVLVRTFDEYYKQIQANNLQQAFRAEGLNLYQAITLASIVQREVNSPEDMSKVSQVFHSRLKIGMILGSDVTFLYAAAKMGVAPTVDLDSPYNTRVHSGLPPGPIASPGLVALKAVAAPADTDYLYFVAGDDGVTYFARTLEEHDANVARHCDKNCQL
ncbi:MAG: endolytic transglycosylase MltG [Candidatus Saccharimonadaceae bacterium]